jgi:membrane-associated protease RseP (regulator of RpoE activity)
LIGGVLIAQAITDMGAFLSLLENLFLIALVLTTAVGIHEFCHLLTARALRIDVDEYGLAFGPTIASRHAFGIDWKLNAIPVGGYVKLHGETEDADDDKASFVSAAIWKKVIVFVAGPISNLILALLLLLAMGLILLTTTDLPNIVAQRQNASLIWWLQADWQVATNVVAAIYTATVNAIGAFAPHATTHPMDIPFAGLPSMATVSSKMLAQGPAMFLLFAAAINLSLGFMNLLPIPPLDGGQAFAALVKSFVGRFFPGRIELTERLVQTVTVVGLGFLVLLMVYINGIDLLRNLIGYMPSVAQ